MTSYSSHHDSAPSFTIANVIHRLQQASCVLGWSVFLVTLTSSLGYSSLWISLGVSMLSTAGEAYLLWRGSKDEQSRILELPRASTPEYGDDKLPVDDISTAGLPVLTSSGPTSIPSIYKTGWIWWRGVMAFLWIASFGAVLALILLRSFFSDYIFIFAGRVIELVVLGIQIAVMVALFVLTIMERKRVMAAKGGQVAGF